MYISSHEPIYRDVSSAAINTLPTLGILLVPMVVVVRRRIPMETPSTTTPVTFPHVATGTVRAEAGAEAGKQQDQRVNAYPAPAEEEARQL